MPRGVPSDPERGRELRKARARLGGATTWHRIKKSADSRRRLADAQREMAEAQDAVRRRDEARAS